MKDFISNHQAIARLHKKFISKIFEAPSLEFSKARSKTQICSTSKRLHLLRWLQLEHNELKFNNKRSELVLLLVNKREVRTCRGIVKMKMAIENQMQR